MAKTMKNRRLHKRNTKQNKKHKIKKSPKSHGSMRKNIKRVSLKNFSNVHKRHTRRHRHRALHNSHRSLHGGKKHKKQKLCDCGCGKKCGHGCGCGKNCGCSCSKTQQTRKRKYMKGGMVSSPASGPVGYAWKGGNEATWPGVAANHGINTNGSVMSNHFAVSPNGIAVGGIDLARSTNDDPIITPPMNGGRNRGGGNNQKGGFFQEIVNLGRGVQDGINGGYFDLIGKQQPLSQNPWPTEQPIANTHSNTITTSGGSPNIDKILVNANNKVAGL